MNNTKGEKLTIYRYEKESPEKDRRPMILENTATERLRELNEKGYGIFETANSFFATQEDIVELAIQKGRKGVTKRNKEFLTSLDEVFADLDITKEAEGMNVAEREEKKKILKDALEKYFPPTTYIITKNGLQPRWKLNEESTDEKTQIKYRNVINGIIEWSKQYGGMGDPVKDVTRFLRKPGYYHLKSDPYFITEEAGTEKIYTLDELKKYFWFENEKRTLINNQAVTGWQKVTDPMFSAIDAIDIRQIAIDAWKEKGFDAYFDEDDHLVIDNTATATFKGRLGGNYIATTSSDYPAKGNATTYVAATLGISNKEAVKWLCNKYNIEYATNSPSNLPLSDRTNAEELVEDHEEIIRYCHQMETWLVWNGSRWTPDANEEVMTMADATLKRLADIGDTITDKDQKKSYRAHIKTSLSRRGFDGMMRLAEWNRRVVIAEKNLDVNLWRLNCLNGEIDLKTGELLPHNKESYFTKVCPVSYEKSARLDLWDKFLLRVLPDETTRKFVQRAVGYTLTGTISEEKLFFAYGGTATGKSTFLGAIYNLLGDFGARADFETFIAKDRISDAPRIDLARLAHKRFVMSLEVDDGKKLAQGLVKQLTGGDAMTARFLYKENFEFMPTFKLWFASNHQPSVSADDEAMWRRIVQIPFTQSIPKEEQDTTLKDRLQNMSISGSAILAWAVEGCLDWQKNGLGIPPQVIATTEAYRREMDSVQDFIEECCEVGEELKERFSLLWNAYQNWEYKNKIQQKVGRKQFAKKLNNLGYEELSSRTIGRIRKGIKIRQQDNFDFENIALENEQQF